MSFFNGNVDLSPARKEGESFVRYIERRSKGKSWVKKYLRTGTAIWTSCVIVSDIPNGKVGRKLRVQGTMKFRPPTFGKVTRMMKKRRRKLETFAKLEQRGQLRSKP